MTTPYSALHLVVPGQVIASSSSTSQGQGEDSSHNNNDSFLRGHGTYLETVATSHGTEQRLVASVCGIVERVNKLITVIPSASNYYQGQVGDLVVGRVTSVGTNRWTIYVGPGKQAQLPLTGIHLPGGVQRIRTSDDARQMRTLFQEGDLVSAEIHKVQPNDGSLLLHTRSTRYGKLQRGIYVEVPPSLIVRRKHHYTSVCGNKLDVVWGTNGGVWIQRSLQCLESSFSGENDSIMTTNEMHSKLKQLHADTPLTKDERLALSRFANAIACLRQVHASIVPEHAEKIFLSSQQLGLTPSQMLWPDRVLQLTEFTRQTT